MNIRYPIYEGVYRILTLKLGNNGKEKENIIRFVRYPERGRG